MDRCSRGDETSENLQGESEGDAHAGLVDKVVDDRLGRWCQSTDALGSPGR